MRNVFYVLGLGKQLLKVAKFNFSWKNLRLINSADRNSSNSYFLLPFVAL